MSRRAARWMVLCSSLLLAALLATVAVNSARWVGTTFPGFFVMANRVVPSITLPTWSDGRTYRLFQSQVQAVDGLAVHDSEQVYRAVAGARPGTVFDFTVRTPAGATEKVAVASQEFTTGDFALLFGAYLVNGLAFVAIGLLVLLLKPGSPASVGFFAFCTSVGVFVVTAADLYGPAWFFRLHVVAESLLGAGALHLALVFPVDRLQRRRGAALLGLYAPFVALAMVYELLLWSPSAYTKVHLVATAAQGIGAGVLIAAIAWGYLASRSALVRRKIGLVALATTAGFLLPAVLLAASSLLGGSVPLNTAALTAFLFPLGVGYAIVQQDLFEIDVVLRRAATYVVVVAAISLVYLTVLVLAGAVVPGLAPGSGARLPLALLNLAVLLAIAPVSTRVRRAVDRVFFRGAYDPDETLARLGRELSRARTIAEVTSTTLRVVRGALWPRRAAILLRAPDASFASGPGSDLQVAGIELPAALEARCERGEILASYQWEEGGDREAPAIWRMLAVEVIVPIRHEDGSLALLVLGTKESGRAYNPFDVTLLRTAASQAGLAMTTARAFGRLADLNASLEGQVRERTVELENANGELSASVAELRRAYLQLERSQESLIRADRLAALGRLAAGIAHEMNTPLGAVMNSLQVLRELGREYAESIDEPSVLAADHREIAAEIVTAADAATAWARKAAAFIRRMKLHGRDLRSGVVERFPVAAVVEEVKALLAHRLRASRCTVELREETPGLTAIGDPSRLGQVLVNLIVNAIDAYEDRGLCDGAVTVHASPSPRGVTLRVEDRAGGIPPDCLPRIFDELFTTKEAGRGTGLGLCIARHLVEQGFGGALTVRSEPGVGTCFTVTLASDAGTSAAAGDGDGLQARAGSARVALADRSQGSARTSPSLP